jgi:hypothetical protein
MHPFEDVQGYAGFTAQRLERVCGPLARDIHSLYALQSRTVSRLPGYAILNAPRFKTRALEGFLCTQ